MENTELNYDICCVNCKHCIISETNLAGIGTCCCKKAPLYSRIYGQRSFQYCYKVLEKSVINEYCKDFEPDFTTRIKMWFKQKLRKHGKKN